MATQFNRPQNGISGTIDGNSYGAMNGVAPVATYDEHALPVAVGHKKVIIVGAGICGITQAGVLMRDKTLTLKDMMIFDVQKDFGGVWEKNRYPGCACDIPALAYTTSFYIYRGRQYGVIPMN